eukprot:349686-Chlamydomonas_euryale.AAC.11
MRVTWRGTAVEHASDVEGDSGGACIHKGEGTKARAAGECRSMHCRTSWWLCGASSMRPTVTARAQRCKARQHEEWARTWGRLQHSARARL